MKLWPESMFEKAQPHNVSADRPIRPNLRISTLAICLVANSPTFSHTQIPFSLEKTPTFSLFPNSLPLLPYREIAAGPPWFFGVSFDMVSPETTNWLYEYGLIEDIPVPDSNFANTNSGFAWTPMQALNTSANVRYCDLPASSCEVEFVACLVYEKAA